MIKNSNLLFILVIMYLFTLIAASLRLRDLQTYKSELCSQHITEFQLQNNLFSIQEISQCLALELDELLVQSEICNSKKDHNNFACVLFQRKQQSDRDSRLSSKKNLDCPSQMEKLVQQCLAAFYKFQNLHKTRILQQNSSEIVEQPLTNDSSMIGVQEQAKKNYQEAQSHRKQMFINFIFVFLALLLIVVAAVLIQRYVRSKRIAQKETKNLQINGVELSDKAQPQHEQFDDDAEDEEQNNA